ncbi:MAG TPA: histidine kinase [Blastocatellia bacterium]|nr:histidine kinase [Blastocatellia bacterium]
MLIGSGWPFCHNYTAMNQHWHRYWAELGRYSRPLVLAPLIALIPFLLNLEYWRENGGLWAGLRASLIFGTVIGLTIALFFGVVYAGLTWITVRTGKFYQPPVPVQILLGTFGAVTGMWLVSFIRGGQPVENPPFLPVLIFSGMIATAFSLYFAYRQAKEESLALRAEAAEARYHALKTQMRPHFLFNALNSLAELIESGEQNAAEVTYKLSDLYRQILANSGLKTAPLSAEVGIARAYLELEQLRFGPRLGFAISVPAASDEIYLPSLMLQTLVENAIKHGIAPAVAGGHVEVEVSRNGSQLYHLRVTNSGQPYRVNTSPGTGLVNTRARLDLLYGHRHRFSLAADEQGRTVAGFYFTGERID